MGNMKRIPESLRRISKKTWIIIAVVAAAILVVVGFASCSAPHPESRAGDFGGQGSPDVSCYPPLACGPSYAGYIPPYYAAHPSYAYLSPYRAFYAPAIVGHSYTVSRTPAGVAPVAARPPLPYPTGYKPVPGDFQAPTAPKSPAPAPKAPAPAVKAPAVKAPAPSKRK